MVPLFLLHAVFGALFGVQTRAIALVVPSLAIVFEAVFVSLGLGLAPWQGALLAIGLIATLDIGYVVGSAAMMQFARRRGVRPAPLPPGGISRH